MRIRLYIIEVLAFITLTGFWSCNGNPADTPSGTDRQPAHLTIAPPSRDTLCFLRTEGTQNQDTYALKLIINDRKVDGTMLYLPFEKDRRLGYLRGTITDSIINAGWFYEQEGVEDRLDVSFRLNLPFLLQRPNVMDPTVGREILPDTGNYSIRYRQTDCSNLPDRMVRLRSAEMR